MSMTDCDRPLAPRMNAVSAARLNPKRQPNSATRWTTLSHELAV